MIHDCCFFEGTESKRDDWWESNCSAVAGWMHRSGWFSWEGSGIRGPASWNRRAWVLVVRGRRVQRRVFLLDSGVCRGRRRLTSLVPAGKPTIIKKRTLETWWTRKTCSSTSIIYRSSSSFHCLPSLFWRKRNFCATHTHIYIFLIGKNFVCTRLVAMFKLKLYSIFFL